MASMAIDCGCWLYAARAAAHPAKTAAPFSAIIMVGALVLREVIVGITGVDHAQPVDSD